MKREGHSRSHAAMLIGQPVKRRDGRRIAQDNGYLATLGNVRGLALSAGLGLGHGLALGASVGGNLFQTRDVCGVGLFRRLAVFARYFGFTKTGELFGKGGESVGAGLGNHGLCLPLSDEAGTDEVFSAGNVGLASGCVQIAQLHGRGFRRGAGSGFVKGFSKRAVDRVHGLLRAGCIPAMWERYAVTSDNATTVRREFLNNRRAV